MRRRELLASLASLASAPALAQALQNAVVVPSCGTPAAANQPTMDTTGRLCSHHGGAAAVLAHRYWQIYVNATSDEANGADASIAELQFRVTAGVPLLFSGGTASANSVYGGSPGTYDAIKATDNNPATFWSAAGIDPNPVWMYDYGVGVTKNIVEITVQARPDASYSQSPLTFTPQWSDDGVNWTSMAQITAAPWTAAGQIQTFEVSAAGVATSVWSAADAALNSATLTNGGLTVESATNNWQTIRGSISKSSGKLYIEFLNTEAAAYNFEIGGANAGFTAGAWLGQNPQSFGVSNGNIGANYSAGAFTFNSSAGFPNLVSNDVTMIAVDFAAGSIWLGINNTWLGGGNPATGASPYVSFVPATVGALFPALGLLGGAGGATTGVWTLQPTAASQKYAPPAGFTPWG